MSTTLTYPNQIVNDLTDQYFIGGTDIIILNTMVDSTGSPINLASASQLQWKMSALGDSTAIITKTGSYVNSGSGYNIFRVDLTASDTLNLTGDVFLHQFIVVDLYGKTSRPSQGKLYITKPIQ